MQGNLKLSIEGMHCGGCVRRVTAALKGINGVDLNSVDVGLAEMSYDADRVTEKQITDAVDRLGFVAHVERS